MSTLSNAAATRRLVVGNSKKAAKVRRAKPIRKPAQRKLEDPLGDFSEQTGAQFG